MGIKELMSHVHHTLLAQTATWEEIRQICDDAVAYQTASVCIPPSFVKQAKEYMGDKMAVCTEIDMVINIGWAKAGLYDEIEDEIRRLKAVCGDKILKVIIETCLLTEEEKIKMCQVVTASGADYIKTSTGFSKAGATFEDIALFAAHVGKNVKIKAAGGISSLADAERFLALGADRLGTSRMVKLVKNEEASGY